VCVCEQKFQFCFCFVYVLFMFCFYLVFASSVWTRPNKRGSETQENYVRKVGEGKRKEGA
jgi:hypothetical protein